MAYDPKWIREDKVVKRDGENTLTDNWDVGEDKKIVLNKLQTRDDNIILVTDSTNNTIINIDQTNGGSVTFYGRSSSGEVTPLMVLNYNGIEFYHQGVKVAEVTADGITGKATYS